MLLRLEYNGRIIHEIASSALTDEIVIGRSHGCTWPVPKEDAVASSRHVSLTRKGKTVLLKDLGSTNGTFHNGKKIAKKKLKIGDKIGIGNCVLCVEPDRGAETKVYSELLILSGKARGQKKQLVPPRFTIGSDPASNLVFLDMLVSRRHAEILIKEDASCWIRDLGSKNGTSVNGVPLRDDKERLLKDGDRIALSHLEFEFHDGAVQRSNKQVWLRIGILAATAVLGLSLYAVYQRVRPAAETYLREARQLAAKESFAEAAAKVEKAATARHAASNQVSIEELRRLLGVWQNTVSIWSRAQSALAKSEWTQVSRDLGLLQSSKKDAWEWSAKAAVEKENMARAKLMLDAFLRAETSLGREDLPFDELTEDHKRVKEALAQLTDQSPEYLSPLKAELERVADCQAALLDKSRKLEQALDLLKQDAPPYASILETLGTASAGEEGFLKRRALSVLPAVQALAEGYAGYENLVVLIRELELMKALSTDVKLPTAELCAIDPRVSHARFALEKAVADIKVVAGQFAVLFSEVEKRIGRQDENPECFRPFGDSELLAQALACDSLQSPLPKRSRREPVGAYDRLLGVEEFYTHLSAYPEAVNPALVADLPFPSALTQMREAVQKIEAFLVFARKPENQWLVKGNMQTQLARLDAILARRAALVKDMVARAEAGTDRATLIAGGIAARLSTQADPCSIKGESAAAWVAAELKRQRAELLRLNDEYGAAAPARQIEIRGEILAKGLPGDPLVRRMWAVRDAAGASQRAAP